MISDAKVSNRIAAYGACYLDYANKSITATTFGEKDCADKEYRNMVYMMWAQSVMKRYRCGCITEDYACAVIAKADPICSKCQCAGAIVNPVTPVTPCNIAPDFTVARTVIASDQQNIVAGGPFFIISNTNQWQGSWGNSVGYIVGADGLFTPVPDGAVVYDQSTATYWTNTPTFVPGEYLPVMNGAYVDGSLIVSSPYPAVNTLFDRLITVEAFVDGVWVRLYGPDSEQHYGTPQTYLFATQPTKMRTSYSIGNCVACPDPNLTYELVSAGGGYNLEVTMAATNGFTPGEMYVEQGGVPTTPQTFGALPDTLTFGPFNVGTVTIHFANLIEGCPPYVENIGVPFGCTESLSVTTDGTGTINVFTNTGYLLMRKVGEVPVRYNSGEIITPSEGSYCFSSCSEDQSIFGEICNIYLTGGISEFNPNNAQGCSTVFLSCTDLNLSPSISLNSIHIRNLVIDNSAEGTLDLSLLPILQNPKIKNNETLVNVVFPTGVVINGSNGDLFFDNNAFSQATVDAILDATDDTDSGTIDISGGTNSPPSADGLIRKGVLEAAGWTVNVNS